MSAITLVNTFASNAIVGSLATKLFDSLITTKFTQNNDKKKWIREKKLNLFAQLTDEILSMNCENLEVKKTTINELSSKICLLAEDNNLKINLDNYTLILNEYECFKNELNINLEQMNQEVIANIRNYMKKI